MDNVTGNTTQEVILAAEKHIAALKTAYIQSGEREHVLRIELHATRQKLAERDALLRIASELLTTISGHKTTSPSQWCDHFQREVKDRIQRIEAALSASAEPVAQPELQLEDSERQRLIAWGRNCGLEEASKVCQRMAHEAYYPPGTRFKHFTPKAQMRLGDILIKAANAIGGLPDGPYERFHVRQGNEVKP